MDVDPVEASPKGTKRSGPSLEGENKRANLTEGAVRDDTTTQPTTTKHPSSNAPPSVVEPAVGTRVDVGGRKSPVGGGAQTGETASAETPAAKSTVSGTSSSMTSGMGTEATREAEKLIRSRVKNELTSETMEAVVKHLMADVVETEEDLAFVTERDFEGILKSAQARRVVESLKGEVSTILIRDHKITIPAQTSETTITESPTAPSPGKLVKIRLLNKAGLSEHPEWEFYARDEMAKQWKFLDDAQQSRSVRQLGDVGFHNLLLIGGPPGIGKSTTTWHWCCAQAATEPILWIHKNFGNGGSFIVCLLTEDRVISFDKVFKIADVETPVDQIFQTFRVNICVFDGVTADADQDFKSLLTTWQVANKKERILIFCASVAFVLKYEAGTKDLSVLSWTLDEYAKACANESFWENVKELFGNDGGDDEVKYEDVIDDDDPASFSDLPAHKRLALRRKFYIAGHCARWMLGTTPEHVAADVQRHVKTLDSIKALLDNLLDIGESANRQVNHLRTALPTGPTFTSKFVARCLALQRADIDREFIEKLNDFAIRSGNPAFEGWCLEFDFLSQVRAARHPTENQLSINDEHWPVRKIIPFTNEADVAGYTLEVGTWLIPTRWNQSTFDAVTFASKKPEDSTGNDVVEVVPCQVTRGLKHTVKSPALYKLAKAVDTAVKDLSDGEKRPFHLRFVRPKDRSGIPFEGAQPTAHGSFNAQVAYKSSEVFFNRRLPAQPATS